MRHSLGTTVLIGSLLALSACKGPAALGTAAVTPQGAPAAAGAPIHPAPAITTTTIAGLIEAPAGVIAAGSGNIIGAGSGNIIAAGSGNIIGAGSGNLIAAGSGNLIAAGSGNLAPRAGGIIAAGAGNIIGAGSGNLIAAGSGNIIGAGSHNYRRVSAAGPSSMARVEAFLADAQGNPIKGMLSAIADDQGRYVFVNIPVGFSFQVIVRVKTAQGKDAVLKTLVRSELTTRTNGQASTDQAFIPTALVPASSLTHLAEAAIANIGMASTLVTDAVLASDAGGGTSAAVGRTLGGIDATLFQQAVSGLASSLDLTKLPDLGDPAAVAASANSLVASITSVKNAVGQLGTAIAKVDAATSIDQLETQGIQAVTQQLATASGAGATTGSAASGSGATSTATNPTSPQTTPTQTTAGTPTQTTSTHIDSGPVTGGFTTTVRTDRYDAATVAAGSTTGGGSAGTDPFSAAFGEISGVDIAPDGTIVVADVGNQQLRRITPTGAVVIAGLGSPGFSGDSGAATSAAIDTPRGLLRDVSGQIFFCDSNNQRIRVVKAGIMYTVAGGGANTANSVPTATSARLNLPFGLAGDANGDLYFTERAGGRVCRINGTTGALSTLHTGGTALGPIAIDRAHHLLWYADGGSLTIVDLVSGIESPLAFTPVGTGAPVISALTFDQNGTLYAAQSGGSPFGTTATQIWGLPVNAAGQLAGTAWLAAGSGATLATSADGLLPATGVADARTQALNGAGWCGLAIDLSQAASPTQAAGQLYYGASRVDPTGQVGQVIRLDPRF